MHWHVVSFPPEARLFIRKRGKTDFSPAQKIRAAIRHYVQQPLWLRIQTAREYLACQLNGQAIADVRQRRADAAGRDDC
jgi:hypothetical protein